MKFGQKWGKSTSKMFQVIKQVYGEEALGHNAVLKWHKCFACERDSMECDKHTGWPRTARTELRSQDIATLVCLNCCKMVDEVVAKGIGHGTFPAWKKSDVGNNFTWSRSSLPQRKQYGIFLQISFGIVPSRCTNVGILA